MIRGILMVSCTALLLAPAAADAKAKKKGDEKLSPEMQEAMEHFDKGVTFFDREDYEAAVVEFLKSHELSKHWAVRYNIGICYAETGRPVEAAKEFRLYLEEGGKKIGKIRRAEIEKLIAKLEERIGYLVIEVDVVGATVIIDGVGRYETPFTSLIPVKTGFHAIEVSKGGYADFKTETSVASGEEKVVTVELEPVPVYSGGGAGGEAGGSAGDGPKTNLRGLWVALAAGGALAAGAGVSGTMTLVNEKKMHDEADSCEDTSTPEACPRAWDLEDKAKKWQLATNVLWGAAGAAALTGIIILIVDGTRKEKSSEKVGVVVVPVVAPAPGGETIGIEAAVTF